MIAVSLSRGWNGAGGNAITDLRRIYLHTERTTTDPEPLHLYELAAMARRPRTCGGPVRVRRPARNRYPGWSFARPVTERASPDSSVDRATAS